MRLLKPRSGLDQPTHYFDNRRNNSVNRNRECLKVVDTFGCLALLAFPVTLRHLNMAFIRPPAREYFIEAAPAVALFAVLRGCFSVKALARWGTVDNLICQSLIGFREIPGSLHVCLALPMSSNQVHHYVANGLGHVRDFRFRPQSCHALPEFGAKYRVAFD